MANNPENLTIVGQEQEEVQSMDGDHHAAQVSNHSLVSLFSQDTEESRTLGRQFAGRQLYEIPECFDEVIIVPFSKEEEIVYR